MLYEARKQFEEAATAQMETAMCKKIWALTLNLAVKGWSDEQIGAEMYPYTMDPRVQENLKRLMHTHPFWWGEAVVASWAAHSEFSDRRLDVDQDCYCELEVGLFPCDGWTLGLLFGNDKYFEQFMKIPEVEDYSYWNNTEEPDDISPKEWMDRGAAWDDALPTGIPSKDGVFYQMLNAKSVMFPVLSDEKMEQFVQAARKDTIELLVKKDIHKSILKHMARHHKDMEDISVVLEANDRAVYELRSGSRRCISLMDKYETLVPHTWDECLRILLNRPES